MNLPKNKRPLECPDKGSKVRKSIHSDITLECLSMLTSHTGISAKNKLVLGLGVSTRDFLTKVEQELGT